MERRKHDRVHVEFSALFSGSVFRAQGVILNLSMAGCRARSAFAVKKDDWLGVLIDVPKYEQPLYVTRAAVRWVNAQEFGVEFVQMELIDQQRLGEVVQQTEVDQPQRTEQGD